MILKIEINELKIKTKLINQKVYLNKNKIKFKKMKVF